MAGLAFGTGINNDEQKKERRTPGVVWKERGMRIIWKLIKESVMKEVTEATSSVSGRR